jgi:hypothetical protein
MIRLIESDHDLISLFGHDLRADAARPSRGRTGLHFSGSSLGGGIEPVHRFAAIADEF